MTVVLGFLQGMYSATINHVIVLLIMDEIIRFKFGDCWIKRCSKFFSLR